MILFTIFFLNIVMIIFATLSPFKFNFWNQINQFSWIPSLSVTTAGDFIRNIILFIPFSFTFNSLLFNKISSKGKTFWIITLSNFLFSLSIEILQLYLPQRTPTLIDLIANTLGGYIGYILFEMIGLYMLRLVSYFSILIRNVLAKRRNVWILIIGYTSFALSIIIYLNFLASLSNWDSQFPLVIGNELTGDRPWNGYMEELHIFNEEMSAEEIEDFIKAKNMSSTATDALLVSLDFRKSMDYQYAIPHLSQLKWSTKDQSQDDKNSQGVFLDANHWLRTKAAAKPLIEAIKESSQLSIITSFSTSDLKQKGPARIISISENPRSRNITLSQEGSSLIVRIRTPFTRENGDRPSIVFPDVFIDTNKHYFAYTYSDKTAKLFVDKFNSSYTVIFNPASKLFWSLNEIPFFPRFTPNFIYPGSQFLYLLNIIFYCMLALPIFVLSIFLLYVQY